MAVLSALARYILRGCVSKSFSSEEIIDNQQQSGRAPSNGVAVVDILDTVKRTIVDSYQYAENYDKIKVRPLDINTKDEFPLVV